MSVAPNSALGESATSSDDGEAGMSMPSSTSYLLLLRFGPLVVPFGSSRLRFPLGTGDGRGSGASSSSSSGKLEVLGGPFDGLFGFSRKADFRFRRCGSESVSLSCVCCSG